MCLFVAVLCVLFCFVCLFDGCVLLRLLFVVVVVLWCVCLCVCVVVLCLCFCLRFGVLGAVVVCVWVFGGLRVGKFCFMLLCVCCSWGCLCCFVVFCASVFVF